MTWKVYGIPSCGSCKKALAWLKNEGIEHAFVDVRDAPPSRAQIGKWVTSLGAKAMRNTSGKSYRALPVEKAAWSDAQWIEAFADDAMLLKRPLFEEKGQVAGVGFRDGDDALRSRLKR